MTGTSPAGPVAWFVRHAESAWNQAGLVQGQADAPGLTVKGEAQARAVAESLAGCGAQAVLTSDLRRAVETARIIARRVGVPLVTDPLLRERNLGGAEGRPVADLDPSASGYRAEVVVDPEARPPGGESLRQLYDRVARWVATQRAAPIADALVVVTHGGFLRTARSCFDGGPVGVAGWPATPNADLWRVDLGQLPNRD